MRLSSLSLRALLKNIFESGELAGGNSEIPDKLKPRAAARSAATTDSYNPMPSSRSATVNSCATHSSASGDQRCANSPSRVRSGIFWVAAETRPEQGISSRESARCPKLRDQARNASSPEDHRHLRQWRWTTTAMHRPLYLLPKYRIAALCHSRAANGCRELTSTAPGRHPNAHGPDQLETARTARFKTGCGGRQTT